MFLTLCRHWQPREQDSVLTIMGFYRTLPILKTRQFLQKLMKISQWLLYCDISLSCSSVSKQKKSSHAWTKIWTYAKTKRANMWMLIASLAFQFCGLWGECLDACLRISHSFPDEVSDWCWKTLGEWLERSTCLQKCVLVENTRMPHPVLAHSWKLWAQTWVQHFHWCCLVIISKNKTNKKMIWGIICEWICSEYFTFSFDK